MPKRETTMKANHVWEELYKAAVVETDSEKLPNRSFSPVGRKIAKIVVDGLDGEKWAKRRCWKQGQELCAGRGNEFVAQLALTANFCLSVLRTLDRAPRSAA
jgi:hypothetical protein